MTVVKFVGLDGAGKSTCCQALARHLRENGYTVYSQHWIDGSLLQWLPSSAGNSRGIPRSDEQSDSARNAVTVYVKFVLVLLNAVIMKVVTAVIGYRFDFVLYDRYLLDDLVHLQYRGLETGLVWLGMCLVNQENVVYVVVDPKTALARNHEHPDQYYYEKHALYDTAVSDRSLRVDGSEEPAVIAARIAEAVQRAV